MAQGRPDPLQGPCQTLGEKSRHRLQGPCQILAKRGTMSQTPPKDFALAKP